MDSTDSSRNSIEQSKEQSTREMVVSSTYLVAAFFCLFIIWSQLKSTLYLFGGVRVAALGIFVDMGFLFSGAVILLLFILFLLEAISVGLLWK